MTDENQPLLWAAGMPIPARLIYAIRFLRGEDAGLVWLAELDGVLRAYEKDWNLELESIAVGGAMSCCAYCRDRTGTELVLKVPVEPDSGAVEARALRHWANFGISPRVVEADPGTGVFLMERVRPGSTFTGVDRVAEARAFIELFVPLEDAGRDAAWCETAPLARLIDERLDWAQQRFAAADVAPLRPDLERAAEVAAALNGHATTRVVHGDLQAKNLLWGPDDRLFCIDPLIAVGDPASDVAMWAVMQDSPVPITDLLRHLARELSMDLDLLEDWAFVVATAELRPLQPARFTRQRNFLEAYVSAR